VAECKSCRRSIYWVRTTSGAKMPIDAIGSPTGNIVIVQTFAPVNAAADAYGNLKTAEVFNPNDPRHRNLQRYTSHFATCPAADQHRRKRR